MLRQLVASAGIVALANAGCGGRAWPRAASAVADPEFVARDRQVVTVDVLPVDLAVWLESGLPANPDEVRGRAETRIVNAALATMTQRSFGIGSMIDWNGDSAGGNVLAPHELNATVAALSRYGETVEDRPTTLPAPALPVKLGQATGADTTLYVGGWAYVAAPRESTGEKVAKGVFTVLLVAAAIGAIYMIATAVGDSKSSSDGKKSGGKPRNGGAAIPDDREASIVAVRDHRGSSARDVRSAPMFRERSARDHRSAAPVANVRDHRGDDTIVKVSDGSGGSFSPIVRDHRDGADGPLVRDHRDGVGAAVVRDHRDGAGAAVVRDHRIETRAGYEGLTPLDLVTPDVVEVYVEPQPEPTWRTQDPMPDDLGKRSVLYLETTLVDNHTGRVLWHAHQSFPANAGKSADIDRAVRTLLATLPAR